MSKHSPAPWILSVRNNCWAISDGKEDIVYVFRPQTLNGEPCGSVTARGRSVEEMEANAHLIKAAPELLEACKLAVTKWEMRRDVTARMANLPMGPTNEAEPDWVCNARAAIAKVETRP